MEKKPHSPAHRHQGSSDASSAEETRVLATDEDVRPEHLREDGVALPAQASSDAAHASASEEASAAQNEAEALLVRARLRRGLAALVGLVILSFVASWLFRDWLTAVGHQLIGAYGARGVFTSVFFIDWVPIPTSSEPIYLLGISSGMDLTQLFVASSAGGVVAALGCYASGAVLERTTSIGDWTRARYPGMVQWVAEKGFKGLALAAVVPLPFSPMMWIAGVIGMPLEQVVIISLLRIPKTVFYILVLMAAWGLT